MFREVCSLGGTHEIESRKSNEQDAVYYQHSTKDPSPAVDCIGASCGTCNKQTESELFQDFKGMTIIHPFR